MNTSDLILLGSFAAAVLLVIAALAIVYGRMNRRRRAYSEDGPDLFDQRYDKGDDPFAYQDDFASIRISREPDDDEPPQREPGPLTADAAGMPYDDVESENETPQNVVPLRAPEPEPEPMRRREEAYQAEPMQMAASDHRGNDYSYGREEQGEPQEWSRGAQAEHYEERGNERRGYDDRMSSRTYDEDNAPFVAPYIREYIEESERRQTHRLDDIRDDMRRQLSNIREEQSNRLDLFLGSIDRKLSGATGFGGDREDGNATRRRIDGLSTALDRLSDRLDEIARSVEKRMGDVTPLRGELRSLQDHVLSFRRDVEANTLAIGQIRDNFDSLQENFGRMERSFLERAQNDQSVNMRLADVVRGTLDDEEYELNARLSNGHTADSVIYLRGGRTKVAIDARFPIESFNKLPSRDAVRKNMPQAKASEDDFRRTVLRAIFSCSDRCIVAGETADSAILFLPSEAAYTILHDRFPDLVRDSHRARVWLTSPSTLMGVLNLLHNVLPGEDEPLPPQVHDEDDYRGGQLDDDGGYYTDHDPRGDSDAASIEERLRALRAEEEALAQELVRTRNEGRNERRSPREEPRRRGEPEDDFENRLERFSFDLDDARSSYSLTEDFGRRSFRDKRDDDLR